jgi:hypothetical protein
MAIMASYFVDTFKIWDVFFVSKVEINNEWNNMKIN